MCIGGEEHSMLESFISLSWLLLSIDPSESPLYVHKYILRQEFVNSLGLVKSTLQPGPFLSLCRVTARNMFSQTSRQYQASRAGHWLFPTCYFQKVFYHKIIANLSMTKELLVLMAYLALAKLPRCPS